MIVTQTPLRIGLAGGGTDLPAYYRHSGGMVLSAAIDKYIYVIVKQRFGSEICLNYTRKETVTRVEDIQHELIREAMLLTGVTRGVEITTLADIPSEGSGLGSSSTVTVGLLNALHAYQGRQVPAEQLAEQACDVEINRCGKPIGKQDQYIAALGGIQALVFHPDDDVTADEIDFGPGRHRDLQRQIMLFYTGKTRSANTILNEQNGRMETIRPYFDQLRDIAVSTITQLSMGNVSAAGPAVQQGWKLKRELGGDVTNDDIDRWISLALAAGAAGAKITGAGGGGFLLVICPPEHQAAVRQVLSLPELPVKIPRYGTRVILNTTQDIWT
jgi:D-glycero-alpha-D-manno-heptose-7-phosphate kinase